MAQWWEEVEGYKTSLVYTENCLIIRSIRAALELNSYNRLAAARDPGIPKSVLFRKIKRLGTLLPIRMVDLTGMLCRIHATVRRHYSQG